MDKEKNRIIGRICCSQAGDHEATLELLSAFEPLLKKYTRKLNSYDWADYFNEFQLDFLELLQTVDISHFSSDYQMLAYIRKSIYNSYLKKAKQLDRERMVIYFHQYSEEQLHRVEQEGASCDSYFSELPAQMLFLTELEYQTVYRLFVLGFTAQEVAEQYGVSRQAVNRTKARALKKIRGHMSLRRE